MTIAIEQFTWNKVRKELSISAAALGGSFPKEITVFSKKTGRDVTFTPITYEHAMFDQDGWDGEMCLYEPKETIPTVEILVVNAQQWW